jgi:predicted permease
MMALRVALRQRLRDWRTSLAFITVIAVAVTLTGTWLAISYPLLRDALPYPNPERLVTITADRGGLSWKDMEDLRGGSVESMAAFFPRTWAMQTENHGHIEVVNSHQITGEFFKVLGLDLTLDDTGKKAWIWFTHDACQRFLGGDPNPVNRVVWLNAVPYRVAGVLPKSFDFPRPDVYIALNRADYWNSRGGGGLGVIARLKPGVAMKTFQSELNVRATALASEFPSTNRSLHFVAGRISSFLVGNRILVLRWLMVAVLLLLTVAMANASGIWLAQWLRQQRRVAIQMSLGASKSRIAFSQAVELCLLGSAAAAIGLLGVSAVVSALRASSLFSSELEHLELWQKAGLNPSTAILIALTTLACGLLSGLLPVLLFRESALEQLRAGGHAASSRSSRRLRVALAAAQLTLTGTLAYAGIMIARDARKLLSADRGFRTEQILVSGIGISEAKYNTDEKMIGFHQRAIAELKRIPGVIDAAGGFSLPVTRANTRFLVDDEVAARDRQRTTAFGVASPELLPLLGIPCVEGRMFTAADQWNTPRVAMVNRAFAARYLSDGRGALRRRLRFSFYNGFAAKPYTEYQIVGVVGDTLNRDLAMETEPQIIISSNQMAFEGFQYFVRSTLPAAALKRPVPEAIWSVDPEVQRVNVTPLVQRVEQSLVSRQLLVWLLNVFGGIAILVVVFGLASSLSATFLEMTRDLAIRSALGASPRFLAYESVRWALLAVVVSEVLIAPASIVIGRLLILDRAPAGWDAVSWAAAAAVLAFIGIATAFVPARSASSIDPSVTLRTE